MPRQPAPPGPAGPAQAGAARARLEQVVDTLLAPGGIRVELQPMVRLTDGTVAAYEALARTDVVAGGPDSWLAAAGLVGRRVDVELACLAAAARAGAPPDGALLTVNVSPDTVLDPRLPAVLAALPPHVVELTEHDAVHDYAVLRDALDRLRAAAGSLVAVDDVGAGYASMAHVLALTPDVVKIDRALVDGVHADAGRRALVQGLAAFTAATGGQTVAEGVERVADLRALRLVGVDLVQGYLLARPGPGFPRPDPAVLRLLGPHAEVVSAGPRTAGPPAGTAAGHLAGTAAGHLAGTAAGHLAGTAAGHLPGTPAGREPASVPEADRDLVPAGTDGHRPPPAHLPAVIGDFGLLHVLAVRAHADFLAGDADRAIGAARRLRAVAELAGDRSTVRYLRYAEAVALLDLGRGEEAMAAGKDLLAEAAGGTVAWRCKALAVVAEAHAQLGATSASIAALAEADWVLRQVRPGTYGHVSASMAMAHALRSATLFERADAVLSACWPGLPEHLALPVAREQALLRAQWVAMVVLAGRRADARRLARDAMASALRMARLAHTAGDGQAQASGRILEAAAWLILGEEDLAAALARAGLGLAADRRARVEVDVAHLVLGRVAVHTGDDDGAREHLSAALAQATSARREVWANIARTALAELDERQHGSSTAAEMWQAVAHSSLAQAWTEREARFAALRGQDSLRTLAARVERDGRASEVDPLTGLGNRRVLRDLRDDAATVIFVDVDDFKGVNDRWSHLVGDRVLQEVAAVLRSVTRGDDLVIRYGGDEFVVVPHGDLDSARLLAHRIRVAVAERDWDAVAPGLRLTISAGIGHAQDAAASVLAADRAMLAAKRAGRNRVVEAPAPPGEIGR